jgi:hypothetical protein
MLRKICAECKADLGSIPSERDGVSHGLCADCVKRYEDDYFERKSTRRTTVEVKLGSVRYVVDAHIQLPRRASHAGADSPRFMDPGAPERLLPDYRILRDGLDVTAELLPAQLAEIERKVCEACGVPIPAPVEVPPSFPRPALSFWRPRKREESPQQLIMSFRRPQ